MNGRRSRREFLSFGSAAMLASTLRKSGRLYGESEKPVRFGFVGVGDRGSTLVRIALDMPGVEIPAICDINEDTLEKNLRAVEERRHKRPEGYSRGDEDFRRLVIRDDLDAVITATPWQWHTPVMIAAMEAGKFAVTEVPAAYTVEDCWKLVRTSQKTKMPLMMLENVCYYRNVMAVLNMVRQGVLGELNHCEGGYQHDILEGTTGDKVGPHGELLWRGEHAVRRNGNLYPTHPIGPIAHWMNINRGDRFTYLVSMSSPSRGINHFIQKRFGPDHPNAKRRYALGDISTTLIKTHKGLTVTLYFDTQSPRPYDLIFRVQGTSGIYSGTLNKIYIEGVSPTDRGMPWWLEGAPIWEDTEKYFAQYDHPLWRAFGATAKNYPHNGGDYLEMIALVKAVREKTQPPIDVYDAATWSVISPLSERSVAQQSAPVEFPDFTEGKWATQRPTFGLSEE